MKKIKTANYVKKEAQWEQGNLPPEVTEYDISKAFDPGDYDVRKQGNDVFEIERDWDEYGEGFGTVPRGGKEILSVTVFYEVEGWRESPRDWRIDLNIQKIVDSSGNDIKNIYPLDSFEEEDIENQIRELILNT